MRVVSIRLEVFRHGTDGQNGMEDTVIYPSVFKRCGLVWQEQQSRVSPVQKIFIRSTAETVHPLILSPVMMDLHCMICMPIIRSTMRKTAGVIRMVITTETAGTVEQKGRDR